MADTTNSTIVLFKSELVALNHFSDQLEEGFVKLGYDIYHFDIANTALSLGQLYEYMQNHYIKTMIGFNSMVFGLKTPSGANVWNTLGIPCINILVDHPYWYHEILDNMPECGIVLCIDRNHMEYVNTYFSHLAGCGFLPHGGSVSKKSPIPINDRSMDILYTGSLWSDYTSFSFPKITGFSFDAEKICKEALDYLLDNPANTVEASLKIALSGSNIDHKEIDFKALCKASSFIESYAGSYYRVKLLESIATSGYDFYIYGNNWEQVSWINLPNVHYKGFISPYDIPSKVSDAKLSVNSFPWFKDGSHERIFDALLNGTIPVTEDNNYLRETIPSDLYISYDLKNLNVIPNIEAILSNKENLDRLSKQCIDFARDTHSWFSRAKELHEDLLVNI